jgi:hypothetical protein
MRRFAQDCDPKTYLCTASGSKDAQIAHIKRRVPLGEKTPHVDKASIQARRKGKHKEYSTAVAQATKGLQTEKSVHASERSDHIPISGESGTKATISLRADDAIALFYDANTGRRIYSKLTSSVRYTALTLNRQALCNITPSYLKGMAGNRRPT